MLTPLFFSQQQSVLKDTMPSKKKPSQNFILKKIQPLTENQKKTFEQYQAGQHLLLHGVAGTGKTFISLYLALHEVLRKDNPYTKVMILRSIVPSREIGFLPGSAADKAAIYELPYQVICNDLFGRADGYELLKTKECIEFVTTSYLRGLTFTNCIVIIDECQNLSGGELSTAITRIGENCRVIISGDYRQTDLRSHEREGFLNFLKIVNKMKCFSSVEFGISDIVRSGLCKEFLLLQYEMNISFI